MRGCRCRNAGLTGWQKVQTCRGYPLFAPFAPSVRFALHPPPLTFQVQVLVGLKRQTGVASRCNAGFLCIALPCHTSLRGNFCCVEEMPETLSYCGQRNCTFWLYRPSPFPRNNLPRKATPTPPAKYTPRRLEAPLALDQVFHQRLVEIDAGVDRHIIDADP